MPPKIPRPVIIAVALAACVPFVAFAVFFISRVTGTIKDWRVAIPFVLFALVLGVMPLIQILRALRKPPQPVEGVPTKSGFSANGVFLLVFALFWSALVLAFDGFAARLADQVQQL